MVIEDNDETQMWLAERYFFMVSSLYEPHVDSFVQTATENPTVGSNVSSIQKVLENNRGKICFTIQRTLVHKSSDQKTTFS